MPVRKSFRATACLLDKSFRTAACPLDTSFRAAACPLGRFGSDSDSSAPRLWLLLAGGLHLVWKIEGFSLTA